MRAGAGPWHSNRRDRVKIGAFPSRRLCTQHLGKQSWRLEWVGLLERPMDLF